MNDELAQKIEKLQAFCQQDPDNVAILIDLFESYLQQGSFEDGIQFFLQLNSAAKTDPMVTFKVGTLALAVGNYPMAEECFSNTVSIHGDHPAVLFNLAYSQYYQQKFEESSEALQKIGDEWEAVPESQVLLARCLHHLQNIDEAIVVIEAFLKVHTEHTDALGLLSLLLLDSGDDEKALHVAQQALEDNDSQLEAMIALSSSAISLQDPELAKNSISMALEKHGHVGRLWSNKGQLDMLSLDIEQAKSSLQTAVELMPNHIGTWHLLGWCQLMSTEYPLALNSFEAALDLNRNFGETHGGIAVTLVLQNRLDEATDAMRRAVKLDPDSMAGQYAKSLLLEKSGKTEEAKALMEELMQSSSSQGAMGFLPMIQQFVDKKPKG